jgi:hypothetical protein
MTLKHVHRDDVVEVDIKGRRFRADVEDLDGSVLRIRPLTRNISYRHASAANRPPLAPGRETARVRQPQRLVGAINRGPATSRV